MASREAGYAESNGSSTYSTNTAYQDKVSLTLASPAANSDYLVLYRATIREQATGNLCNAKFLNSTTSVTLSNPSLSAKDGTNYHSVGGIAREQFGASPASTTWKIQYATGIGAVTAEIRDARLAYIKMAATDLYGESRSDSTTTSASAQDKVTLTQSTAAGDFLVIASCDIGVNNDTNPFTVRLDIDGSTYGVSSHAMNGNTGMRTWQVVKRVTLTAASHTFKLQYFVAGGSTATIRNAAIAVIDLSTLDNNYYAEQFTRQTRTASTYADAMSLNATPQAKEHFVFACSQFDNSATTTNGFNKLVEDSTDNTECEEEPRQTANQMTFFTFYKKTLAAASTTWHLQHKNETTGTVGTDEMAIAVIQTESSASGSAVGSASGAATVSGVGAARVVAVGSAAGTSTATAVGAPKHRAIGASAGTCTVAAVGASHAAAVGSASGAATVSGIGSADTEGIGSAAGTSTCAAVSAATKAAVGSAAGTSTCTASGQSVIRSVGSASGTSTATAESIASNEGVGSSAGTSTANAVSNATKESIGASSGISTCSAVNASKAYGVGSAAGTSTCAAVGQAAFHAAGACTGTSTASAVGKSQFRGVGSAAGTSTCAAVGDSLNEAFDQIPITVELSLLSERCELSLLEEYIELTIIDQEITYDLTLI